MATAANASMGDGFFADSQDVFLHGLTGANRQGTCSSLPVLYVAVGRRLGYPLKLVTTKGHLFVRWESASERFNFEAAGNGANRFSDDYYRRWPLEVSEAEIQADGHLKSLTPAEELAVFLSIRGMCQAEVGRYAGASESFAHAARLAPSCHSYFRMRDDMKNKSGWSSK
jgi:regulator of sirC expression with transglutaminase-like and TPR domain